MDGMMYLLSFKAENRQHRPTAFTYCTSSGQLLTGRQLSTAFSILLAVLQLWSVPRPQPRQGWLNSVPDEHTSQAEALSYDFVPQAYVGLIIDFLS